MNNLFFLIIFVPILAFILLGSTSIPHLDTINPNNLLEVTPKTHYFEFNLMLNSKSLSKKIINTSGCCFLILYFHIMQMLTNARRRKHANAQNAAAKILTVAMIVHAVATSCT